MMMMMLMPMVMLMVMLMLMLMMMLMLMLMLMLLMMMPKQTNKQTGRDGTLLNAFDLEPLIDYEDFLSFLAGTKRLAIQSPFYDGASACA